MSQQSPLLRHAVDLNNRGVNLLAMGEDTQALPTLTESLCLFKKLVSVASQASSGKHVENATEVRPAQTEDVPPTTFSSAASSRFPHGTSDSPSDGAFEDADATASIHGSTLRIKCLQSGPYATCYTYHHALGLSQVLPPGADVRAYAATVILNIALVYHSRGVYDKAERMYEMVLQIMDGCAQDEFGTCGFLQPAAINNLSLLRWMRGDYEMALRGFEFANQLLVSIADGVEEHIWKKRGGKNEDDTWEIYEGLLLNTLTVGPHAAAAAA